MRDIDITLADIRCTDDICVVNTDSLVDCVEVTYELWFDVYAYFGTHTRNDDGSWINFYTYYSLAGDVTAAYFVESDKSCVEHEWILTEKEKEFFLKKMEDYCQQLYSQSLEEFRKELI